MGMMVDSLQWVLQDLYHQPVWFIPILSLLVCFSQEVRFSFSAA